MAHSSAYFQLWRELLDDGVDDGGGFLLIGEGARLVEAKECSPNGMFWVFVFVDEFCQ